MKDNEAFVSGRSKEKARALLAAAEEMNMEAKVVRTTDGGYIIPVELADYLEAVPEDDDPAEDAAVGKGESEDQPEEDEPKAEEKPAPKTTRRRTRKTSTAKAAEDNKSQDEEE